jgi:hypothetical protein
MSGAQKLERAWQPWERNFSGGRIGVQEQQGENENWMVLDVESGIGKTTTSLRLNEAWDLALMISPQVKARLFELLAARRRAETALHQFTWADTLSPTLRKVAEEWDCDSSQCEFASDDMGGLSCPQMEREEGCRAIEAAELRQFADALEVAAPLRAEGADSARIIAAAPKLYDGCNALLGLLQLVLGRDDLTPELRYVLETNHRIEEARAAVAKADGAA